MYDVENRLKRHEKEMTRAGTEVNFHRNSLYGTCDFLMDIFVLFVLILSQMTPCHSTTTPPPGSCIPTTVADASFLPDQSYFSDGQVMTYTCDTGYELTSGDLILACSSGTWNGTAPSCTITTCTGVDIEHGSRNPLQAQYNYSTDVIYSCDEGYTHASGDLVRTCLASKTWNGTEPVCTNVVCPSGDIDSGTKLPASATVVYNTSVTYACDVGYEITSGDAERACQASGDLTGTLPICTIVSCLSSDIVFGTKLPAFTSVVFNTSVTYTCDVGYEITSGNAERTCQASGELSGTLPACTIKTCTSPEVLNADKTPISPTVDYNTTVEYACDIGYNYTAGDLTRTCQADTSLSGDAPTCTLVTCSEPANVTLATKSPIQPIYNYSEQVIYSCDIGYKLDSGDLTRTCTADGTWSGVLPACTNVTCAAPAAVPHSLLAPVADPYLYNTTVTYTCNTGYENTSGSLSRICQANGAFSGTAPVCSIKQCAREDVTDGTVNPDQTLYDYNTNVTYECNLGFNHTSGDLQRTCDDSKSWTGTLPVCTVAACLPETVTYGNFDPPHITAEFGTNITYTCDLGYYISAGDDYRTCQNDGSWTNTLPTCSFVRCNAPGPVPFSSHTPSGSLYDYNKDLVYTCDLAYNHTAGNLTRTCKEDFTWTGTAPTCTIAACIQEDSTYMETTPDKTLHEFGDLIMYECILGYNHSSGDLSRTCQNDGTWTGIKPECVIVTCNKPNAPAHASILPDVPEVNYNTYITYVCNLGYNRTGGDETRRCTENATFEGVEANCTLVTCDPPDAISDGTYSPVLPEHDYNTTVNFTCNFGYYHFSGDLTLRCDENANWVDVIPVCEIVKCPKPTEEYTTVAPDQSSYNFNTSVTSSCVIGYNLTDGDAYRICQHTGEWDGTPPNCTIVECDAPPPVPLSSLTPQSDIYVYLNTLNYTCNIGYEVTSGDDVRTCTETGEWSGSPPNCTIIHCPLPPNGVKNTYSPALLDYIWNDTVVYTCDIGYNNSVGDFSSSCLYDKTWSGVTPSCSIVTCNKIDVPLMTFDPPTNDFHVFNTTIEYSCVVGYNHSHGDLSRTCNYTGEWTGTLPNCTIITCDPPDPIPHTFYIPVQGEHDWNTSIDYSCHSDYHYVSGVNTTTCNESGSFPPVDLDCSVNHFITVAASEPAITWINSTVTQTTTVFDFDGMCDVTVTCIPDLIGVSHILNGSQIIMTITETPSTNLDEYICTLSPFRGERTFQTVSRDVFYGNEIIGFQAWLDHSELYLEVGKTFHFEANATLGSLVSLLWILEDNVTRNDTFSGEFTYFDFDYTFASSTTNVTVTASNAVSGASITIPLMVIYAVNGFSFSVNEEWRTTIETAHFELDIENTSYIPMAEVNVTIALDDGNAPYNFIWHISDALPVSLPYQLDVIFDIQGNYNVTTTITNPLSSKTFSKYMRIWDQLEDVQLICVSNCPVLVTNDTMQIKFTGVPRSGFEYFIDMKDSQGTLFQSYNSSILYELYDLSNFVHIYTSPGYYKMEWNVTNGGYAKDGSKWIKVQNIITDFQAYLDHDMIYLAVWETYTFIANATDGTSVFLDWEMESNVTEVQSYPGQFSYGSLSYAFQKPKHNITVTARNLVSSQTLELALEVFYKINNFELSIVNTLGNTTESLTFDLHLLSTANLPMRDANITIDFNHGDITTDSTTFDENYGVDVSHFYSHLFDMQGSFLVEAKVESILGYNIYNITVSVWDSLDILDLEFINNIGGKYIITNTQAEFNFTNVPNFGFKYSIDYGDGTVVADDTDSLLYNVYALPVFTHVYTSPGVYIVRWTAMNGEPSYNRDEQFPVHVQNIVPDTGFSLEPLGKTYPWSVLQTLNIGLNITLDSDIPKPTNATCIFNPDDGNDTVDNLVFDDLFFAHEHGYRTEGLFNSTLHCSNDVSVYVYIYDIEVRKFQASELTVFFHQNVPLNKSDTVVVFFHIDNGGYEILPKHVYLTWDYGDEGTARRRRAPVLYDKNTFTHLYTERGNYTVSVLIEAQASNTSNILEYSLRLGLMYFEFNTTVQFLNTTVVRYTMYGVKGTTTYTIDFDDGTASEQCSPSDDTSKCDIHHLCPEHGYQLVQVVASNRTFIEIDNMNMTCDNPIVNLTTDIPYTVAIPNGTIDAKLRIKETDLFLPLLFCTWNMGDPIKRDTTKPISQTVTYEDPFLFIFQYIALGRHTITIHCWNLINETRLETHITVTNKDFLFTGVFDRFYSQRGSPMYLSSMIDTEIFGRLEIVVSSEEKHHTYLWKLNVSIGETKPNRQGLLFTRGLVSEDKYVITLEVCFVEEPGNCIFEPTYTQLIMPPPHAEIVGSTRRYVGRGLIKLDAYTLSYDPVFPESSNLYFIWSCKSFDASTFDEVLAIFSTEVGGNCTYSELSKGIINLDTNADPQKSHYAVTVTVDNNRGKTAEFTQIVAPYTYIPMTIECKINCLSKVAISSKLQLIIDLPSNCPASFAWTMKKFSGTGYEDIDMSNFVSKAGTSSRSITIRENVLDYGTRYLISVKVFMNDVIRGPAYYEFLTNKPPQGGFCRIIPVNETTLIPMNSELKNTTVTLDTESYNCVAGKSLFNISCEKWEDEGFTENNFTNQEPIFYLYFLSYGEGETNDTLRQLLYFDPGQTSNLVSFQVGNVNDDYKAIVVVRIADIFGDYVDIRYRVKSEPSLITADLEDLSNDGMKTVVSDYIEQFEEDIIKANRTNDYRTISRKVMDITSVYNELEFKSIENSLLNTSSGILLTPEDLLSLGYVKTDDDKLLSWQDYWKIIVEVTDSTTSDYLVKVGETHTHMLYASIKTWPSSKRMTLVAIETISRALHASTLKLDYSNITAAILGAECADIMARNLADISNDRTFPNTEQLFAAATSVHNLIRNILAILQTVLTPNLPQDPTVDEMRNYLEYIRVFKTTEEVLNAQLSIQEQTFLAQKQLQKYHLQKYIKSEASKKCLPHLTYALKNLTYVLGRMTVIGGEELYLENDYVYVSVETRPASELDGKTVSRPRVALEINKLLEDQPEPCNSSEVLLETIVFKHNPYFWGQFADRITSYVPLIEIHGASLDSDEITYRLENKVEAVCRDQDPTYEEDDPDKMIYILFDRQHSEDDILIFVRPNTSELIYELYFNKNEKPKISENLYTYSTEMKKNDDTWTLNDGYKLLIKSSDYSETGKIWIGLRPLLENSGDLSLLTRKFCANVTSVSCLAWKQQSGTTDYAWDKDACEVSLSSTRTETICKCKNTGDILTAGTTFYIPYNMIDFKSLDTLSDAIGRSPVIGMVVATVCAYILLVIWALREDVKDQYKWAYSLMVDNDIADSYFYIVRVFTGLRTNSGTESKVGFVLVGEDGDTNIRILDDESHIGFERGSVRTFVMSTRRYLGDLLSMRIWHDDSGGNNSSWYLNKINVTDLKSGKRYVFVCNKWFDYDSGDTRVDRVLNAQPYEEVRSYQDMISYTLAENHLWISVVVRPMKSNFTRIQRLSCLLGLIYLTMIICTMVLEIPEEQDTFLQVVIGPFRFSMENFKAALIAVSVASFIIIIVSFFFKNAESDDKIPALDSFLHKAYRNINDKVKLDKSVVGRRYRPPAEEALEYNYFFLPHMCVYVGWTILVMSLILATYLLVSFSSDWALIKSEEWMTAIFVSMLCSFLLIEGIKVIIILLFYSLLCQRAYEPPEPYIDIDRLEEITKYNSATLTIGPQYNSVLYKPENPSKATLIKNQIKRIRNHQLLKIVTQLAVYGGILYLVYTISYESRDLRSFYLKNHVENLFHFQSEVTDLESYTNWLKGTFIDTYFSNSYFGAEYAGTENKIFMEDLSNMRVGPARLRQLRIKSEDCIGPLGVNMTCHNKYEETKKETKDLCLRWQEQPCPVSEKSSFFSSPAWEYKSADEVWGFPTIAQYCTYGGGGYFMKLDVNREVCEIIFDELVQFSWFDKQTRAVILEFTLYNANTNLFVYSKFVAEFPEVGGFLPYIDIQVFRLYLNAGQDGDFILFLQFFFLLGVIAATVVCAYELCTDFRAFFKSMWNILDLVALFMSYTTISMFIYKIFVIQKTIQVFENDKNAYIGFENLAFYDFITNTAYGVLVFLLSIRVSRILGYSGKINEMADVITNAASDLYGFLLIFAITYFAYVVCGTLLFGKEQEKYKDPFQTYGTLTEAIIGKNRVSNILIAKPGFAEFYYFTFVLFVLMTLATMAAAILNFSISVVKEKQQKLAPTNIVEVIFDRMGKLINKIMPSKRKSADEKLKQRRDSDTELSDILGDLRLFIKDMRSKKLKKIKSSDKYRLTDDDGQESKSI